MTTSSSLAPSGSLVVGFQKADATFPIPVEHTISVVQRWVDNEGRQITSNAYNQTIDKNGSFVQSGSKTHEVKQLVYAAGVQPKVSGWWWDPSLELFIPIEDVDKPLWAWNTSFEVKISWKERAWDIWKLLGGFLMALIPGAIALGIGAAITGGVGGPVLAAAGGVFGVVFSQYVIIYFINQRTVTQTIWAKHFYAGLGPRAGSHPRHLFKKGEEHQPNPDDLRVAVQWDGDPGFVCHYTFWVEHLRW